jgi:hypothetical protein
MLTVVVNMAASTSMAAAAVFAIKLDGMMGLFTYPSVGLLMDTHVR